MNKSTLRSTRKELRKPTTWKKSLEEHEKEFEATLRSDKDRQMWANIDVAREYIEDAIKQLDAGADDRAQDSLEYALQSIKHAQKGREV